MTVAKKSQVFRFCTVLFFLFCMSVALFRTSLAHAATTLKEGVSGTCGWKYEEIDNEIVFTLHPLTGEEGTLDDWTNDSTLGDLPDYLDGYKIRFPNWLKDCHESAQRILVKGRVKARTCQAMFCGFRQAVSADLSGLDVTGVESMCEMFQDCLCLTTLDVGGWDVSSVTNMRDAFRGCSSLVSLDVSRWNVSSVTDMAGMFAHCTSLVSLDLSAWDTSAVRHTINMFLDLPSLRSIRLGAKACVADESCFDGAGSSIGRARHEVAFWVFENEAPLILVRFYDVPFELTLCVRGHANGQKIYFNTFK